MAWTPFALHNYACSIAIGVVSFSCLELSGLSQGLLQSVLSLQVSVTMPYCYGFNRRQLWLLAQGLLQSVPSFQVSVAMPYYSIVMVSIGSSSGSLHRVSFSLFFLFR